MSIEARLAKVLAEKININEDEVKPEATLEDLGADSLDIVEIVMGLEEEFKIQIPDEDADKLKTVGDVVKYIQGKVA